MKKETLQNIVYSPLYLWFKLHAILPMRILYILSDILYFPLYYIVHYRRKLVSENLRKAFPDKTDKELKQLEQKFYHHFCDYIVETIKLMHISDEEMRRRMKFEQVEIIDRLFEENRSIIILLGHFYPYVVVCESMHRSPFARLLEQYGTYCPLKFIIEVVQFLLGDFEHATATLVSFGDGNDRIDFQRLRSGSFGVSKHV